MDNSKPIPFFADLWPVKCDKIRRGSGGPAPAVAEYINVEAILCSQAEAGKMLAIGKTKLGELIAQNKLETVRIGTRRLVRIDSIRRLAGIQPEQLGGTA